MEKVLQNIKKEPSEEFLCILPSFDESKTLGGKSINSDKGEKEEEIINKETNDQDPKFVCEICHKSFRFRSGLFHHAKAHDKVQCQICNRMVRKLNLEKHLKTHENEKDRKFQCKLCQQKFLSHRNLEHHLKIDEHEKFSCDLCGYSCIYKHDLIKHLNRHVQGGKYKCVKCHQFFESQSELKIHMEKRYMKPKECDRINESDLSCRTCGKEFKRISDRNYHEKVHAEKVECPICHAKLKRTTIRGHLKRHEVKKRGKKFKCGECSKMFWTKDHCREHERTHNKFVCDHCGTEITKKNDFVEHLMTHFNPQTFDCRACEKTFSVQSKLKEHIRKCQPSGSKQFECEICQKAFKTSNLLKQHERVHKPRKTCPICSKSLSVNSYRHHIKWHGDKKKAPDNE